MAFWNNLPDTADLALTDGAIRPLPEPQTRADTLPATATHRYYEDGTWKPAAAEEWGGHRHITPVVRLAPEERP